MTARRGLSKKAVKLRGLRWLTGAVGAAACVAHSAALLAHPPAALPVVQTLAMVLMAVSCYGWMLYPLAGAVTMSFAAMLMVLWAWAATASALLGGHAALLTALVAVMSWQQHRRRLRLQRLRQKLDDVDEDFYLKEQAYRLNRRTHETLQHKAARYQQLQAVAERLSRLVNLEAIAQLAVTQTFELIGKSDACLLFLVDPRRRELALYASEKTPDLPAIQSKHGDQFDRYVLRTQRPLLVNDVQRDFRFSEAGSVDRSVRSVIACPVRVAQRAEGVLRLDSREAGAYTQDDLRILDILLDLVDTAVANARFFAQTQQLALTDGLTALSRRQPFMDQLAREIARAQRSREPLAVLMLDLDDFKRYNDAFGHPAGDVLLRTVADLVRQTVPPDGMCARYGGEEFAIFLPKTNREQGAALADRIRQAVEHAGRPSDAGPKRPVTVSLGVAVFPDDAQSDLELIRRADERLYQAKRMGKNRVWSS